MSQFPNQPTPRKLQRAYAAGFVGSRCDPVDTDRLLGELRHPVFAAAAAVYGIRGAGAGRVSLPFRSVLHFDPQAYSESQTTGDCVSHATRNAADLARAVEIHIEGQPEGWHARGATEGIYGSRGHSGQGMSCSGAARFVHQAGGILLRQAYPELGLDLSTYDARLGIGWGRSGVPAEVARQAARHQVRTISLCQSVEEARDALANGYGLSVCSGWGFSSRRDAEGFARPRGRWAHAMAWIACDEEHRRPGFLVQNSWGRWNTGPRRHDQPEGSFWIDFDVAEAMLRDRGAWVLSNVDGFPPRKLPDYGAASFL